jgi:hypothetical protein
METAAISKTGPCRRQPACDGVALLCDSNRRLEKRGKVKRILKVLTYIAAGLYLLVDALFMTVAKPIADWIS